MHWLFERMIVFIMVVAMIAGFLVVTAPPAISDLRTAPPDVRPQFMALVSIPAVAANALFAFGFFYVRRTARDWRRFGLSRGAWLFLFCFAYLLGVGLGLVCFFPSLHT